MIRFAPERPVAAACPSNRLPSLRNWWCHAWKGAWMEHGRMEGRNCISSGFMRPPPVSPFADWLARGCIYPLYIFVRSHLPPVSFAPFFPPYSLSPSRPSFIRCAHYRARRRCRRGAALPPRHAPRTLNYGMAKPRSTHPPCVRARVGRILNGLFQRLTPREKKKKCRSGGRKSGRRMGS